MSVRVVCPSCNTAFDAADEFAGRTASCPACGAAVPVPAPGALAPADAVEVVEEAAELPVAEPIPEAVPPAERPRAAPVRRDDPRPLPSHKLRDESPPETSGLGGAALVLALFAGVCLLCCGGLGFGLYWAFEQAGRMADQSDGQGEKNPKVTIANYNRLELGMTEAEVEAILGPGQTARASHLAAAFADDDDFARRRKAEWSPKVEQDRALVWVNGGDHLFVAFHGKPDAGGRLQMKEFVVRNGAGEHAGIPDDAQFARRFGPPRAGKPKDKEPAVEVSASTLVTDYRDAAVADPKYKGKELTVTDAVFESVVGDTAIFRENVKALVGTRLQVHFTPGQREKLEALRRGDRVKFKARCDGRSDRAIVMRQGQLVP
jgi:hypothetical protein